MPWKERTVEELREEFVQAAAGNSRNFSALCREFGITRKTGYKWIARSQNGETMQNRSRKPHSVANRTAPEIEQQIVAIRQTHPGWGARKILHVLGETEPCPPCVKTVNNILNRYHCIDKEESLKHMPHTRFEKESCNEMWQVDFKGEFRMQDGNYCFPLDIMDDHSRFAIRVEADTHTAGRVIPTFREAFYEYGMPDSILSDNGAQFAGFRQGYTQFEKWLMNHDVLPIHGRIKHPQTQGKIERFHRTMKQELLKHYIPTDIADAARALHAWRDSYNCERPHEALGMKCPAAVYVPSARIYCDAVEPYIYGSAFHVIKVNSWGYVRFDRFQIYLSETMAGEYIEFRPHRDRDTFVACYRNFAIGEFDARTGELLHRRISRL